MFLLSCDSSSDDDSNNNGGQTHTNNVTGGITISGPDVAIVGSLFVPEIIIHSTSEIVFEGNILVSDYITARTPEDGTANSTTATELNLGLTNTQLDGVYFRYTDTVAMIDYVYSVFCDVDDCSAISASVQDKRINITNLLLNADPSLGNANNTVTLHGEINWN